jgi:hypothetical protein
MYLTAKNLGSSSSDSSSSESGSESGGFQFLLQFVNDHVLIKLPR